MNVFLSPYFFAAIALLLPLYWGLRDPAHRLALVTAASLLALGWLHPLFAVVVVATAYGASQVAAMLATGRMSVPRGLAAAISFGVVTVAVGK
ncbi:MAG: hypothetical protein HQK87_11660, partial [Nitrospinae bacterium]|nr:hypothetical protein [Nitrospinota bacterium]